jgi:ATP-dependent Lon protease
MAINEAQIYLNKGEALYSQKKYGEAIGCYNKAIELDPSNADAYNNRGNALTETGKFSDALADYSKAIELSPNRALFYQNRGLTYCDISKYDEAVEDFTKVLSLEPNNSSAYYNRGDANIKQGKLDEAIDDFSMAIKLNPDYSAAREKRDDAYRLKGESIGWSLLPSVRGTTYRRYRDKLEAFHFTGEVQETATQELEKLKMTDNNDFPFSPSDFANTKNYLDTIMALPWGDPEPEQFDLKQAVDILEKDHYGLIDVKNRVIEFLAVRKMKHDSKGAILCLSGPPGVGKTSMGKSIARATGKPFYRFSIGGINSVETIRGCQRVWVGAQPGQIIKGIQITKSKNLVMMIDEIDKVRQGAGVNGGDPSAALLEVLDPEQNDTFRDQYIDIPFDLSNILFIVTANNYRLLPEPLQDRMEIIEISGYVDREKLQIARKYLIPKSMGKNGLEKDQVSYNDETILYVANAFEKEPGVRLLEQNFDKIHRKIVRQIIEQESPEGETSKTAFSLDKQQVEKYLGKPRFGKDSTGIQKADRPGMAVGLAVQGTWGIPLLIEAVSVPGEEGCTITGNMKKVMKESVKTAFTYAQKFAVEHNYCDYSWFKKNHVHLHIPTANPKDGNSAGITIVVALLSLFKNKVIKDKVVMTGEITLTGQVLAIGGLKEKIISAKNNNAKHIIFPKQNLRDLDEIPDIVKKGIQFHPVERFEEVLALVLPG